MNKYSYLRWLAVLICMGVILFSAWKLYNIYSEYHESEQAYTELAEQYTAAPSKEPNVPQDITEEEEATPISVSFEDLLAECPDVVAWIYCEGTPINYPIVQSEDNDYYLRRLMNGRYNVGGTLFLDFRNAADFSDLNSIVYGHNMKSGTMFGVLPKYAEQAFYEEHPVMHLLTPERTFEIELIGGYVTPSDSGAYAFPTSHEEQNLLLEQTIESSDFHSSAELVGGERLITLSTCVYDYDNARYVLVGVLHEVEDILAVSVKKNNTENG